EHDVAAAADHDAVAPAPERPHDGAQVLEIIGSRERLPVEDLSHHRLEPAARVLVEGLDGAAMDVRRRRDLVHELLRVEREREALGDEPAQVAAPAAALPRNADQRSLRRQGLLNAGGRWRGNGTPFGLPRENAIVY